MLMTVKTGKHYITLKGEWLNNPLNKKKKVPKTTQENWGAFVH